MEEALLATLGVLSTAVGALGFYVRNSVKRNGNPEANGVLLVEMKHLAMQNRDLLVEIRNVQRESLKVDMENQGMIREILERARK